MSHRAPLPDGRRRQRSQSALLTSLAVVCTLWTAPLHAGTLDFQAFNDRQHYSAVLLQQGKVRLDADWNEETEGPITFAPVPEPSTLLLLATGLSWLAVERRRGKTTGP